MDFENSPPLRQDGCGYGLVLGCSCTYCASQQRAALEDFKKGNTVMYKYGHGEIYSLGYTHDEGAGVAPDKDDDHPAYSQLLGEMHLIRESISNIEIEMKKQKSIIDDLEVDSRSLAGNFSHIPDEVAEHDEIINRIINALKAIPGVGI